MTRCDEIIELFHQKQALTKGVSAAHVCVLLMIPELLTAQLNWRFQCVNISTACNGASVSAQQPSNLADNLFGFQEAVNLVSFFTAEVFVHLATWTWRFKWPWCLDILSHPSPGASLLHPVLESPVALSILRLKM